MAQPPIRQDPQALPSQPSFLKPTSSMHTADDNGFGTKNDSSVCESEEEEDIVFQMRGLRGLGGARSSVAATKLAKDPKGVTTEDIANDDEALSDDPDSEAYFTAEEESDEPPAQATGPDLRWETKSSSSEIDTTSSFWGQPTPISSWGETTPASSWEQPTPTTGHKFQSRRPYQPAAQHPTTSSSIGTGSSSTSSSWGQPTPSSSNTVPLIANSSWEQPTLVTANRFPSRPSYARAAQQSTTSSSLKNSSFSGNSKRLQPTAISGYESYSRPPYQQQAQQQTKWHKPGGRPARAKKRKPSDSGRAKVQVDKMEVLHRNILDGSPYYFARDEVVNNPPPIVDDLSEPEFPAKIVRQEEDDVPFDPEAFKEAHEELLCFTFHLTGSCADTSCPKLHQTVTLSKLEKAQLRQFVRSFPCPLGLQCSPMRIANCPYLHICPHSNWCRDQKCGFRASTFEGEGHQSNRASDLYAETAANAAYAQLLAERKDFLSGKRDISNILKSSALGNER